MQVYAELHISFHISGKNFCSVDMGLDLKYLKDMFFHILIYVYKDIYANKVLRNFLLNGVTTTVLVE